MRCFRVVSLDKKDWHRCNVCRGVGSFLSLGDCHRSEGRVPCRWCDKGIVKNIVENYESVESEKPTPYYG